jgi:hypothetical protein
VVSFCQQNSLRLFALILAEVILCTFQLTSPVWMANFVVGRVGGIFFDDFLTLAHFLGEKTVKNRENWLVRGVAPHKKVVLQVKNL